MADYTRISVRRVFKRYKEMLREQGYPFPKSKLSLMHFRMVTDCYWVQFEETPHITWSTLAVLADDFKEIALNLQEESPSSPSLYQANLSSLGSFDKAWIKTESGYGLFKQQGEAAMFTELFVSRLCKHLEWPTQTEIKHPKWGWGFLDFTSAGKECLIHASEFEDYEPEEFLEEAGAKWLREEDLLDLKKIRFMDALICNTDRHGFNWGFLMDGKGRFTVAPNFDNNLNLFDIKIFCGTDLPI
ncbi:MAG: hypothetical protein FWF59_04950 [Turicibacter sp.]|nr:hypothetical protein [Turicibacter sp.]